MTDHTGSKQVQRGITGNPTGHIGPGRLCHCVSGRLCHCDSGSLSNCDSGSLSNCDSGSLSYCDSGSLSYCDSVRLGYCDSGSLGYSDSGVWTIVYSRSWSLAALWRYLCNNSSFETNCILWNVFLIETKIWSNTVLQVNPPSKEKGSSQSDKIHRDKFVEGKYNRQFWVDSSRIGD